MDWFERVPKAELHVHLEGAIPHGALWTLIQKYGGDPDTPDEGALARRLHCTGYAEFVKAWRWKNGFLREYEDFAFMAEAVAADFAAQNIRYAEVFYSPSLFTRFGLETQELTRAIRSGLDKVKDTEIALIADLVRDFGPECEQVTLAEAGEVRDLGVIGIGIGGTERDFPPERFLRVFERARGMGFHTTVHAGETAGPRSVWAALRFLQPGRIGHGLRAGEDPALLDYLAAERIPVDMCPLSNIRTEVAASYEAHPIRRYFDHGLLVTVNTDDPCLFGNTLAEEYRLLEEHHAFTRAQTRGLILNAVEASWLPPARKEEMRIAFQASPGWT